MKAITIVFLTFLTLAFASGIYFCATHKLPTIETLEGQSDGAGPTGINCPDMLIKSGNVLLLYNSQLPEKPGENPLPFYNLDEYINYLEIQRKKGIHCPVLFLQEENNTQGQSIYRIRPDVFDPQGGLPSGNQIYNTVSPPINKVPIPVMDASDDNPPWNGNQYTGFDANGQHVGQYTHLDAIHDSTFVGKALSDNPMDSNWGGVLFTKQSVDGGKYKDREVRPPSADGLFVEESDNIQHEKKASQMSIFA